MGSPGRTESFRNSRVAYKEKPVYDTYGETMYYLGMWKYRSTRSFCKYSIAKYRLPPLKKTYQVPFMLEYQPEMGIIPNNLKECTYTPVHSNEGYAYTLVAQSKYRYTYSYSDSKPPLFEVRSGDLSLLFQSHCWVLVLRSYGAHSVRLTCSTDCSRCSCLNSESE